MLIAFWRALAGAVAAGLQLAAELAGRERKAAVDHPRRCHVGLAERDLDAEAVEQAAEHEREVVGVDVGA